MYRNSVQEFREVDSTVSVRGKSGVYEKTSVNDFAFNCIYAVYSMYINYIIIIHNVIIIINKLVVLSINFAFSLYSTT